MAVLLVSRLVPDELWDPFRRVVPPTEAVRPQGGGRRKADDREVLAGIVFVVTAGIPWRELPPLFGPRWQTVYRRFAQWSRAGVWERLQLAALPELGDSGDTRWARGVIDSLRRRCEPSRVR
ncbi:transposase [Kitasatospora sp. NPDC091335]|uniref:transposase n=1 Tax=Kitasatospora sp. NPDC091335 TaxID=3364085 RepID=UPI00382EA478